MIRITYAKRNKYLNDEISHLATIYGTYGRTEISENESGELVIKAKIDDVNFNKTDAEGLRRSKVAVDLEDVDEQYLKNDLPSFILSEYKVDSSADEITLVFTKETIDDKPIDDTVEHSSSIKSNTTKMRKGTFYASHDDLRKLFNLSEDYVIANVLHDPKTNEFEFIVYTDNQDDERTVDADYSGVVRRIGIK